MEWCSKVLGPLSSKWQTHSQMTLEMMCIYVQKNEDTLPLYPVQQKNSEWSPWFTYEEVLHLQATQIQKFSLWYATIEILLPMEISNFIHESISWIFPWTFRWKEMSEIVFLVLTAFMHVWSEYAQSITTFFMFIVYSAYILFYFNLKQRPLMC